MKLSIITINRNNAAGLEKTVQSVMMQTYTDFEYIVIDGASDDGSVDVIKKHIENIEKITYWISEPDAGIYNAMNKGIRKAKGDYCLFLNSGDWLVGPDVLKRAFDEISVKDKAGIYYSDVINPNNTIKFTVNLNINCLISGNISHQNAIIKTDIFRRHGYYNENLKISSDWEFFLRESWIYKENFIHIETKIAVYDLTGISSRKSNSAIMADEKRTVYNNIFGELADTINEVAYYRNSVYAVIVRMRADNSLLKFLLRVYLFLYRKITRQKEMNIFNNDIGRTG